MACAYWRVVAARAALRRVVLWTGLACEMFAPGTELVTPRMLAERMVAGPAEVGRCVVWLAGLLLDAGQAMRIEMVADPAREEGFGPATVEEACRRLGGSRYLGLSRWFDRG